MSTRKSSGKTYSLPDDPEIAAAILESFGFDRPIDPFTQDRPIPQYPKDPEPEGE